MQSNSYPNLIQAQQASIRRTGRGEICLDAPDVKECTLGLVAMAFPISRPDQLVVVYDMQGEEVGIIDDIRQLDDESAQILSTELEKSYFMPRITAVVSVVEKLGVVTWDVQTDRGERIFQVRNVRQNTRRIGRYRAIIRDVDGNRYEIPNWEELAAHTDAPIEHFI